MPRRRSALARLSDARGLARATRGRDRRAGDADAGIPSLAGLVVAVTPMVVFLGASLTDSSGEIMSIALTAAALRVSRPHQSPRWVWWLAGVAGFVLALSRSLGPLWLACILLLWWSSSVAVTARECFAPGGAARSWREG